MSDYIEKEVKVLNINVDEVLKKLEELGAQKVFDDYRIFTTLDYDDKRLANQKSEIRLTEEDKLKLSYDSINKTGEKETIKVFVSRKEEMLDFLARLDLKPVAVVKSHRISLEWEGIDFDLDQFPQIPAFLEIDLGDSNYTLEEIINTLGLQSNEVVKMSTKEVYMRQGLDYFELFKI